ncbi:MAG: hypothetical protein JOZ82_07145, partial [Marmoricola sp.]|nr:hypothetical protein [Marmoricola sp.]
MVEVAGPGGEQPGTGGEVLVVCRANVCRSPAAQFLLGRALEQIGLDWSVSSAGTTTLHTLPGMCASAAAGLAKTGGATEHAEQHTPRQVTSALVESAGIVLTASQEERSAVARLSPTARTKTFTLVEAATLAEHAGHVHPRPEVTDPPSLARLLHEQRGRTAMPERRAWRRRKKRRSAGTPRM